MSRKRQLSKKQLAVIDELFNGELDEQGVLDMYKVSRLVFNKWLADKIFRDEFDRRADSGRRQSALLIAKYAPVAVAKLIQLTESDKGETARKACIDIISYRNASEKKSCKAKKKGEESDDIKVSDRVYSKLLRVLAEEDIMAKEKNW